MIIGGKNISEFIHMLGYVYILTYVVTPAVDGEVVDGSSLSIWWHLHNQVLV